MILLKMGALKMDKNEILELLENGFEPELISFEFGVPLDIIKKYQEESYSEKFQKNEEIISKSKLDISNGKKKEKVPTRTELEKTKKDRTKPRNAGNNESLTGLMPALRKRYYAMYDQQQETNMLKKMVSTDEEIKKIDGVIQSIDAKTKGLEEKDKWERKKVLFGIFGELKSILYLHWSLDQAEKIENILNNKLFNNLKTSPEDQIEFKLNKIRVRVSINLAQAIESEAAEVEDITKLSELSKKITRDMEKQTSRISSVKRQLENKISKNKTSQIIFNMKNNFSKEVEDVVMQIINGNYDEEVVKSLIIQEAQKRVNNLPKTAFSLNLNQQVRQVQIQINTLLSERGNQYPIKDYEKAMEYLQKMSPDNSQHMVLKIVVDNLISQKKFEEATQLCQKFIKPVNLDMEEPIISRQARRYKKDIVFAEIGSLLLERIQSEPRDDDEIFLQMLLERMEQEKINKSLIVISKNKARTKKITFGDILREEPEQRRRR